MSPSRSKAVLLYVLTALVVFWHVVMAFLTVLDYLNPTSAVVTGDEKEVIVQVFVALVVVNAYLLAVGRAPSRERWGWAVVVAGAEAFQVFYAVHDVGQSWNRTVSLPQFLATLAVCVAIVVPLLSFIVRPTATHESKHL